MRKLELLKQSAAETLWEDVIPAIKEMVKLAAPEVLLLHAAFLEMDPGDRAAIEKIYYHPLRKVAHILAGPYRHEAIEAKLGEVCPCILSDTLTPQDRMWEPWIIVKSGGQPLKPLAQLTNVLPNPVNRLVGGPSPLAATLSGGLLGAGLGYGSGWLVEKLLPKKYFERGKLRKVLAMLGGGLGTLPGIAWGATSAAANPEEGGWRSGWPFRDKDMTHEQTAVPDLPDVKEPEPPGVSPMEKSFASQALEDLRQLLPPTEGEAYKKADFANVAGGLGLPPIQTDVFNRVVWGDPRTPMDVRAATTGLVESASILRGGSNLVSPADIGRVAVGAGSGYVSGMLVGKALGALAGLKPEYQDKLQQTGIWAGVLSNVIPIAFRGI